MKPSTATRLYATFAALALTACTTDLPTAAAPPEPAAAKGGNSSPPYTSVNIGAIIGAQRSWARDTNDAGDVVGGSSSGAFAVVGGAVTPLPGEGQESSAISNASPLYVAGYGGSPSQPLRWTIENGQAGQPTALALDGATFGAALGVNDGGAAVGHAAFRPAIWDAAGNLTLVTLPAAYDSGEGRDINSTSDAVFVFFAAGSTWSGDRGYLRLASGDLIELPPLDGHPTSYANGLSERVGGVVYIAGSSRASETDFQPLRWIVDVTTGEIRTEFRTENAHALGVSNAAATAGFIEPVGGSLKFKAFFWRGSDFLTLNPPRGSRDPRAWAISPSGENVAGEAFVGGLSQAVLWRIPPL